MAAPAVTKSPCTQFPERPLQPVALQYAAEVVLTPVVFGVGMFGGLLSVLLLHRANVRRESSVYVYMAAISVLDLITIVTIVPSTMQDTEVAPPEVTYSLPMAYLTTMVYGISNISQHASTWLMSLLPIVAYHCSRRPFTKTRWNKISTSRLIVFLVVLFCTLIDFPRFLEVEVTRVEGHCFHDLDLWFWRYTQFGSGNLFVIVFPMMIVVLCYALPVFLMIVFAAVLSGHLRSKPKQPVLFYTPRTPDQSPYQSSVLVLVLVGLFLLLQLPDAIAQLFIALYGHQFRNTPGFYEFAVVAHLLVLVRCSINFIVYFLISCQFRKAFSHMFCCCCTDDEYYEPITCKTLCCCGTSVDKMADDKELESKQDAMKKNSVFRWGKKKSKKSSNWV